MRRSFLLTGLASLTLTACGGSDEPAEMDVDAVVPEISEAETSVEQTAEIEDTMATGTLDWALAGEWRGDNGERDGFRHPGETLGFFGISSSDTVIEIWPGGGWYAEILAPWLNANDGTYVAAHFPMDSESENRRNSRMNFESRFLGTELFGDVIVRDWGPDDIGLGEIGTADAVLTFRNIHNWMRGGFTERAFDDFYAVLRPGGVLGVVEHRLPDTREQDPLASSGYVREAYVIAIAREAGFELVDSSEINTNAADTADHPNGVWTLPPSQDGWDMEGFDSAPFAAIGESDRMTLLFRKPDTDAVSLENTAPED